jgi:hypothetical protein
MWTYVERVKDLSDDKAILKVRVKVISSLSSSSSVSPPDHVFIYVNKTMITCVYE